MRLWGWIVSRGGPLSPKNYLLPHTRKFPDSFRFYCPYGSAARRHTHRAGRLRRAELAELVAPNSSQARAELIAATPAAVPVSIRAAAAAAAAMPAALTIPKGGQSHSAVTAVARVTGTARSGPKGRTVPYRTVPSRSQAERCSKLRGKNVARGPGTNTQGDWLHCNGRFALLHLLYECSNAQQR